MEKETIIIAITAIGLTALNTGMACWSKSNKDAAEAAMTQSMHSAQEAKKAEKATKQAVRTANDEISATIENKIADFSSQAICNINKAFDDAIKKIENSRDSAINEISSVEDTFNKKSKKW